MPTKQVDPHIPPSLASLTGLAVLLAGIGSLSLVPVGNLVTLNVLFATMALYTLASVGLAIRLAFIGYYRQKEAIGWTPVDVESLKISLVRRLVPGSISAIAIQPAVASLGGALWGAFGDSWTFAIGLTLLVTASVVVYSSSLTSVLRLANQIRATGALPAGRPD